MGVEDDNQDTAQNSLAEFCALLPRLRAMFRGPALANRRALLEQAVLSARRGEPVADYLAELHLSVTEPIDSRGAMPTAVEAERVPVLGVYLCPKGVCTRVESRGAGSEIPTCDVHDQALRFVADS